jgi:hypothetical protein
MATHQKKHIKRSSAPHRELILTETDNEQPALVTGTKGDARFEIKFYRNNLTSIAKARGTLIKGPRKQKINVGDTVLIQSDDSTSNGDKYYIIHKYSEDDVKKLRKIGELACVNRENDDENPVNVVFDDEVVAKDTKVVEINDDFIADI